MMTTKRMIYLAPVLAVALSTLLISACSESDNKAVTQQAEEQSADMMADVKEAVTESSKEMKQSVTDTIDEVKEVVQSKSEVVQSKSKEITESVKTTVADVSNKVAEETAKTTAVVSAKVADLKVAAKDVGMADGASLFKSKGCTGCHASDAMGAIGPRLAGLQEKYIVAQFKMIRDGVRTSGQAPMMAGVVKGVTDDEIAQIAGYLTAL